MFLNFKKSLKLLDTVEKSEYLLASLSVTQVNKISFMLQTIQKRERMFFFCKHKNVKTMQYFTICYIYLAFIFISKSYISNKANT